MDLFTTSLSLAGAKPAANKVLDGIDLSPSLFNGSISDRYMRVFFFYQTYLFSVRHLYKSLLDFYSFFFAHGLKDSGHFKLRQIEG